MNAIAIQFLKRKGAYKNNLNAVESTQSGFNNLYQRPSGPAPELTKII